MRFLIAAVMAMGVGVAQAATITFTSNPTGNSVDWTNFVLGVSGQINSNVNFNTHPTGGLISNFYLASDGVTLSAVGDANTVLFGSPPVQGNVTSTPLSTGEGLHPASNYLFDGRDPSSLTISFDAPVLAAGLFVIDYFNPIGSNGLSLSAYTGQNGTGTLIGVANSASYNFQNNFMYFMGVGSTTSDIGSIVFRDLNGVTGDTTGIDNIMFARAAPTVPEPTSLALAGFAGLGMAAGAWRRRRQQKQAA